MSFHAGVKALVLCGFRESSRFLLQVLESVSEADLEEVLERILDAVEKQPRMFHHTDDECLLLL